MEKPIKIENSSNIIEKINNIKITEKNSNIPPTKENKLLTSEKKIPNGDNSQAKPNLISSNHKENGIDKLKQIKDMIHAKKPTASIADKLNAGKQNSFFSLLYFSTK